MTQALVLVDIQNDYFPGGRMALVGMDDAAGNAQRTLELFRARSMPIFHVQHLGDGPDATFFLPGTKGVEIHERLTPRHGEPVIQKHFPNAFRGTDLRERLQAVNADEVVVCGAMSHMCIDTTVRAASDSGFDCLVVADACATKDMSYGGVAVPAAHVHAAFMAALSSVFAKVVAANEVESHLR